MLAAVCHPEYYNYSNQEVLPHTIRSKFQAFVVFITHTSFQLYHCKLPSEYLRSIHDKGIVNGEGVTLSSTRLYDFCEPADRREWLAVFVALIEYLRSGESYVGPLNMRVEKNMIHKVISSFRD